MTATLERPAAQAGAGDGGTPARVAMVRWAWRMFRREWRQQLLVLALIVVAVAATIVGAAVATNTPPPSNSGFGTAHDRAVISGSDPKLAGQLASLEHRFGRVDVIENETLSIPGSVVSYQLRAQNPDGPFGRPMLSLVRGRFPTDSSQVAITKGVAAAANLKIGDTWRPGGTARQVVGIVENPRSLLDEFALVVPGQVPAPTNVTVLFDAPGIAPSSIGPNVETPGSASSGNKLNPETISVAGLTVGMLLIALVAVGGFTVLAQRRLRSLGMLASLGATDRNVELVVTANGVVVGVVGAFMGAAVGVVVWLIYRPHLETSAHHVIGVLALPWPVVILAMVLAVVATYLAALRPARSITKVPVVAALSGRPPAPTQIHRSAVPGIVFLVVAFFLLGYSGSTSGGTGSGGMPELALGLVALIPGVILLSPFFLSALARLGKRTPIAVRLALRDLARYRARSGSALAAISVAVLIAVVIAIVAAARYGNSLDYAGPNLASNQLVIYTPNGAGYTPPGEGTTVTPSQLLAMDKSAHAIATSLEARDVVELDSTSASLTHGAPGRNWVGPIYVATPSLLNAFGIKASQVDATADVLTMRPGISALSKMKLSYGNSGGTLIRPGHRPVALTPEVGTASQGLGTRSAGGGPPVAPTSKDLANPVIQEISALPSGTSAPNTVITEHAVHVLSLPITTSGWLIQTTHTLSATQIDSARLAAVAAGLTIETKNDEPTSSEVINWATVVGMALALAILAMSVGLIRSETASDLRTLTATGASSWTRRTITATTAGALGFLGALLGTVGGYIGVLGWIRNNSLNGGISALGHVPVRNLVFILVGMPVVATLVGLLFAGREPAAIGHQPIE